MNKLSSWFLFLKEKLALGLNRYPETIVNAIAFAVVAIYYNHAQRFDDGSRWLMTLAIGIPLAGVLQMLQSYGFWRFGGRIGKNILHIAILTMTFLIVPETPSDHFMMRYMVLTSVGYALFFMVPYFKNRKGFSSFVFYNVGKFFLTLLYVLVIYAGTSAVYFTIDVLFELNLPGEVYLDCFILSSVVFGTMHFLGSVPDETHEKLEVTMLFERLFANIVLPLLSIYTLILHAYFLRILLMRALPEGVIGNLVVWYGLISVLTVFFLKGIEEKKEWLPKVLRYYTFGTIIPVGVLGLVIGIRISDYGLTLSRYLVVIAGIYTLVSIVGLALVKRVRDLHVALFGVVLLLVSFYGPLSGDNLTVWHQNKILEEKITKASAVDKSGNIDVGILEDKVQQDIQQTAYFITRTYGVDALYFASEEDTEITIEAKTGINVSRGIVEEMRFPEQAYRRFYSEETKRHLSLNRADELLYISSYELFDKTLEALDLEIIFSDQPYTLQFSNKNGEERIDLSTWASDLIRSDLYEDSKVIAVGDERYEITWALYSAGGVLPNDIFEVEDFESYLLIKKVP